MRNNLPLWDELPEHPPTQPACPPTPLTRPKAPQYLISDDLTDSSTYPAGNPEQSMSKQKQSSPISPLLTSTSRTRLASQKETLPLKASNKDSRTKPSKPETERKAFKLFSIFPGDSKLLRYLKGLGLFFLGMFLGFLAAENADTEIHNKAESATEQAQTRRGVN